MPTALPADWQDIVARVSGWLDGAAAQLDRHESEFAARFPIREGAPIDISSLDERVRELPRRLAPLETAVQEADAAALESETALRNLARGSETLRLRLAEWVGRAIG
jgi:hypothetical protein